MFRNLLAILVDKLAEDRQVVPMPGGAMDRLNRLIDQWPAGRQTGMQAGQGSRAGRQAGRQASGTWQPVQPRRKPMQPPPIVFF